MPRGWLHWTSAILLLAIFELYAGWWAHSNSRALMDPTLQNDDARIHVMPLHRHDGAELLKDDPVALDMLASSTLGFRLLYMVFIPLTNLFVATKLVQLICHLLILACVLYLARSAKAGLASAILLGFFMLHTEYVVNRMAGGLQRGFAFPVLAIWFAGALTENRPMRLGAAVLGAVTYPSAMALTLGAEGIFMLSDGILLKSGRFWKQVGVYAAVAVLCVGLVKIDEKTKPYRGSLPTYEEAAANPAFGKYGRSKQVPFREPCDKAISSLTPVFSASSDHKVCRRSKRFEKLEAGGPFLLIALLIMLPLSKLCPVPSATLSLFCSSIILYWLARVFAFRLLYIPTRYLVFGMTMVGISLAVSTVGLLWPNVKDRSRRAMLRNFAAVAAIVTLISLAGDRIEENVQVSVERSECGQIWDFVNTLPHDIRIAAHPKDADGISFWTGRAATPGDEQLLPWLDEAWERNKGLTERTLTALYATNREVVVSYCADESISHILLNSKRYTGNIVRKSKTFEPLGAFASRLTAGLQPEDLVLAEPPAGAVVLQAEEFRLIDVAELRKEWDM